MSTTDIPWTADRLRNWLADNPPIPDPLNGATVLYVHPDRHNEAVRIREAYEGSKPMASGGRLHIQQSLHASPNVIAGFKGDECVVIVKMEKE